MRKTIVLSALILPLMIFASCQSARFDEDTGWSRVDVINLAPKESSVSSDIPKTAIIQPGDLKLSPVIDIDTLKTEDSSFFNPSDAYEKSSLLLQAQKKEEIQSEIDKGNKFVDPVLHDEDYGEDSSGALALNAIESSFIYINSPTAYDGVLATYDYIPNRIYELITCPKNVTDFKLEPGELIAGAPLIVNPSNWQFQTAESVENGETIQHLFMRPLIAGLDTSMTILTNRRTYYFRVASFENQYMHALHFRYPTELEDGTYVDWEVLKDEALSSGDSSNALDLSKIDYGYKIKSVLGGGKPAWKPVTVFSTDTRTYIQFPTSMANSNADPAVYLVKNGKQELVNYSNVGSNVLLRQVDAVLSSKESFLLVNGQKERIKIERD